jgi:hypothetical protein
MASLLNRLFPSRTRTARRAAKGHTPAKTRLGVETLDAREMPSVTSVLNGGVLAITANGPNTNAVATQAGGYISVLDRDNLLVGGLPAPVGTYAESAVTKIVYNGGKDPNTTYNFMDATNRPTTFNAGQGNGAIYGGNGVNTFNPQASNCATLFAGTGTNILNRNGTSAVLSDAPFVHSGPKLSYGLISGTPTPAQLAATGSLTATLDKGAVSIAGPSGIGFQLRGNWIDMPMWDGSHIFLAIGNVTLHTESNLPDLTLKTGVPVMVTTKASPVREVPGGEFASISWAGIPLNSPEVNSPSNLLGSYGVSVSGGGTNWGIKLGGDLGSLGVPLNPGVPYLYYSSTTGDGISFGSINANASSSQSFSVAVDPAGRSVMLKSGGFGFGVSLDGEIPYTPTNLPDGIADPKIYGNLYVTGTVPLGDLPASLTGGVVIDLDANNDGTLCGLTSQTLSNVLHGRTSLTDALGAQIGDIRVGVNGELDFSLDKYGINLSAPVGQASAFYTPGLLAFRGQSVNPFAGTKLEPFSQNSTFDLQGWVDGNNQWSFKAEARGGNFFGFQGDSLELDASSRSEMVHVHLTIANKLLGVGKLNLDGQVDWRTGEFDLHQQAVAQINAGVCTFYMTEDFYLSYHNKVVAMNVFVCGAGAIGTSDYNIHAGVMGNLSVTGDGHGGYRVTGSLSASVGGTWAGTSHDTQLAAVTVDNDGFSIDIGSYHPRVNW